MTRTILRPEDASISYHGCVLSYGHFSTIHPGHIRYLRFSRSLGKKLVVALIGDNVKQQFPFKQKERADALSLLGIAEAIVTLDGDEIEKVINILRPEVLVLGNEYKDIPEIQSALILQRNLEGNVQFHGGENHYYDSSLLSSSEQDLRHKRKQLFQSACKRQNLRRADLLNVINSCKKARLIVLGDTIVDEYTACEAIGMSAEAPVIVVKELESRNFIGGAAVVAGHIKALGAHCDLVSVVGNDSTAEIVREKLKTLKIGNKLCADNSRPTTFKKRYMVENQKLFRVSRLGENYIETSIEDQVIAKLENLAPQSHGIVVSDFVYGVVTPRILEAVQKLAKKNNLMLFGDIQCSSQIGSITQFQNFSLLCPNEREARLALQDKNCGLEQLSKKLIHKTNTKHLVMKLAQEGFISYKRLNDNQLESQAFPALSVNPVDVAGAGDSLLALFASALASGQDMMPISAVACCMAAIAVETMGNKPISSDALRDHVQNFAES